MDLGLVKYDAMVTVIAECHRVDELKDLGDKATVKAATGEGDV